MLAICQSLTILLLLANSEGAALIGLGGVNLDSLMAFSKLNPNFLVLPDPNFLFATRVAIVPTAFLRLVGSHLKRLLQLVQFLAQPGK